jgi:glycosyl transferase family 2
MAAAAWLFWISGIALAIVWLRAALPMAWHLSELPDITQPQHAVSPGAPLPSLTIVVPARNEELHVEPALRSLLQLDYPHFEVIAVNDRSTDQTGAIMDRLAAGPEARGKLSVLHIKELPPRWLGKLHAMWLAGQQGTTEWLLFTDADCLFHPECLRRAVHFADREKLDHLVVMPTLLTRSLGERILTAFPPVMAGFVMRPWKLRDPRARDHAGAGAFNLIRRSAYEAVGTYEKLRLEVVDDLKLGQSIKQAGLRQDLAVGRGLVALHWGAGIAGLIANLEKNMFAVLQFRLSLVFAACAATFLLCVWPFVGLALAPGWSRVPFAIAVAAIALSYLPAKRYTSGSPWLFITCPLSATLFIAALLRSTFTALRDGAVTWRGTKYPLEELKRHQTAK